MQLPLWLQELRNLLAITSDDSRQQALKRWEQRWLVELFFRQLIDPDIVVLDRDAMLGDACQHVRRMLGYELGQVMVEPTTGRNHDHHWGGERMVEVRGDVTAIRREPKADE